MTRAAGSGRTPNCERGGEGTRFRGPRRRMKLEHGGDWAGYYQQYGTLPLDFSANISPLGPPEGVVRAAKAAVAGADRYPDPLCRSLRQALGERLGIDPAWILCGNGAADLIWRMIGACKPKIALLPVPSFGEYAAALEFWGCQIREYGTTEAQGFQLDEGILEAITPETDLLLLCQPSNPSGRVIQPALLQEIVRRCRSCGVTLAADECFVEFLDRSGEATLLPELAGGSLVLFRAFTKCYGMAGLRLGYCMTADAALMDTMVRGGQPWAVSAVAQAAGEAALEEQAYLDNLRTMIRAQRPLLMGGLIGLGCRVIHGQANYLLFYCREQHLEEKLRPHGILIRSCQNYRGLGPGWYRVAVRTGEDNRRLLREMETLLYG